MLIICRHYPLGDVVIYARDGVNTPGDCWRNRQHSTGTTTALTLSCDKCVDSQYRHRLCLFLSLRLSAGYGYSHRQLQMLAEEVCIFVVPVRLAH